MPDGEGLVVVANAASGAQPQLVDPVRQLRTLLPRAEIVLYEEKMGPLAEVLETAAADAASRGAAWAPAAVTER
ncbi:hypothetical protein ACF06X_32850 [Streptomyces sp. NPDC015346]|uniref:hypothetical protein n=1 Tax=Streptomyces sp. NPDC015346 TaxID=3364954 RepID=UPI0036FA67CD